MTKYYAGVGSRQTPPNIYETFVKIATKLADDYILRSGAAEGADRAFEQGCDSASGEKEIFIPWRNFEQSDSKLYTQHPKAKELAKLVHPAWDKCTQGARKLLSRNVHQVLGKDLKTPVEFVLCWTKNAQASGGTAIAIKLAKRYDIPVYNFDDQEDIKKFQKICPIKIVNPTYDYTF